MATVPRPRKSPTDQLDFSTFRPPPTVPALVTSAAPAEDTSQHPRSTIRLPSDVRGTWPVVVSYGMGVDSTAVLVLLRRSGIRPDLILFADTGSEHAETYAYLPVIQAWCERVGFPAITVVKYSPQRQSEYATLEQNCLAKGMLPSLAYSGQMHGCSLKFKVAPMDREVNRWPGAIEVWKRGGKVVRVIGYDDSDADKKRQERFAKDGGSAASQRKYRYWYPLQEAHWSRRVCLSEILREGLPEPPKSSCFFCPSKRPFELIELAIHDRPRARRIVDLEMRAGPNLQTIDGLWGTGHKGTEEGTPKPGSMSEFMLLWMLDGRAYQRLPRTGDGGLVGREVRKLKSVGRVYLPVVGDADEMDRMDLGALAELEAQGRAASLALRAEVERDYGPGSVDRMIAEGHVRAARRVRLARARTLAERLTEQRAQLATTPRPGVSEAQREAAKRTGKRADPAAREVVKAANAWDRLREKVDAYEQEFGGLLREFGAERIYRKDDEEARLAKAFEVEE